MEISRLSPDFAVASQLQRDDLAGVADMGFRAVVNNRPDGEAPDQPDSSTLEAEAKRHGLDYVHIPMVPGVLDPGQALALADFMRAAEGPVLAFCRSGTRSAYLWDLARKLS